MRALLIASTLVLNLAPAQVPLHVEVRDALGGAIAGAVLTLTTADDAITATTDASGSVDVMAPPAGELTITVRADGFAPARRALTPSGDAIPPVQVVLSPAPLDTSVTVTAARSEASGGGGAPSTSVLRAADLASGPGFTLDDALRHTPGFSLFRRSTSRVANPTTQGVTLRGLSASGASRTLVLADGVPLNDAFGGWVSWNRVPLAAIDRVEAVRGSASDLYGPDALGGVIQLFTLDARRTTARLYVDGAGQGTARASLAGAWQTPGVQVLAAAEASTSDGYILVSEEDRGPIDNRAGGSNRTGLVRLGVTGAGWVVEGGGDVVREERQNGTPFQANDTAARAAHASLSRALAGGFWRLKGFGGTQGYDQTFSSVNAARTSELPTQTQRVPSETYGVATDWATGGRIRLLAGLEQRHVRAVNEEVRFANGTPVATTRTGGEQDFLGGFGQVAVEPVSTVTALAGLRVERWVVDSFQTETIDDETVVAPRVSLSWRPRTDVVIQGSASRSYRAPTLNERFRGFRVGDTQTRPNPLLEPERLTAFEAGASLTRARAALRATVFVNHLADAIANVTTSTTPTLIIRDRRNAGAIDARGIELEASLPIVARLAGSLGASIVRSRFGDGAPVGLQGNRTPQSPFYQASAEVVWDDLPAISVAARFLFTGAQFEDDRNTLELRRAAVADLMVSRSFARGWLGFVSVDNIFDNDIDIGRTPLRTVGSPRLLRAGLRVTLR